MIKQLAEKHNLPLKTGFNATRGFFVQLTLNRDQEIDLKTLPSEFLKAVKVRSVVSFTTVDLVSRKSLRHKKRKWMLHVFQFVTSESEEYRLGRLFPINNRTERKMLRF